MKALPSFRCASLPSLTYFVIRWKVRFEPPLVGLTAGLAPLLLDIGCVAPLK